MKILGIDLDELIREAVDELTPGASRERQRQALKSDELEPFKASKEKKKKSDDDEVDEAADEEGSEEMVEPSKKKSKDDGASVEEIPEVSAGKLVKILNQMRSGKSLSDKQVRLDFQKYFNTLSGDERVAFYSFLDATSKIVTEPEEHAGDELATPEDSGVEMEAKPKKQKKEKEKPKKNPAGPIIVGERANKADIKSLLRRNR
jgi:hypothetical protein